MRRAATAVLLVIATAGGALAGWWMHGRNDAPGADPAAGRAAGSSVQAPSPREVCEFAPSGGEQPGMVWVPGGSFRMGEDAAFPEEGPSHDVTVQGFWMSQTEVTNAQFARFVAETGHVTQAERDGGSAIFRAPTAISDMGNPATWWHFLPGADWRHPEGPSSGIDARASHPVVHVAWADALAFARWQGHALPTEAQFEFAAQGASRRGAQGQHAANTWQGSFPTGDTAADGFAGLAPVGCFDASPAGLHDLIGNAWEWTGSAYFARHDREDAKRADGFDPLQPGEDAVAVVKGGSYLCSPDYCMRYRPQARIGQAQAIGSGHIGFRTVLNAQRSGHFQGGASSIP